MVRVLKGFRQVKRLPEIRECRAATPQWRQLTAAYLGFGFQPFSVGLQSGPFAFEEKSDVPTFWQIFFREIYPVRRTDRLIVDAGANIGTFSLYALSQNPECRVVAIEPSPASLERLRALLKTHQVDSRCTVIHGALGSGEGVTTIADRGGSQFRRTGYGGISVPMLGLDAALPAGEIDFLKMDIEGAEYDTLGAASTAALKRIRRIAIEYHPTASSPHPWPGLRERLVSAGFRVTGETDDGDGYGLAYFER